MMRLAAFVAVALAAEELPRYATTKSPNQPPSISYSGPKVAVDEGERFDLNIDVSDADVDEDYAGQLDVVCAGGRLDVSSKAGLRFRDAADGVAFRGPQAFVRKALQPLVYTAPSKGRGGDATIRCTVDDLGYSGVGGPRNATVAIPITIKNVNDAPIINAPAMLEVRGEEPLPISMVDPDSDVLSLTLRASHGALRWAGGDAASVLEASGSSDRLAERLLSLTYVPPPGYDGLATVSVTADDREAQTSMTIALRVRRDDAKPVLSLQAIKARRGEPTKVLRATVEGDADAVLQVKVVADNGALTLPEAPPGAYVRTRSGTEVAFDAGPGAVASTLAATTYDGDAGVIRVSIDGDETSVNIEIEEKEEAVTLVRDEPIVIAHLKTNGAIKTEEDTNATFAITLVAKGSTIHEVEVTGNRLGVVDFGREEHGNIHKRTRRGVWVRGNATMVNDVLTSLVFAPAADRHGTAYVDLSLDGVTTTPLPCVVRAVADPLVVAWGEAVPGDFLPPLMIDDADDADGLFEVLLKGDVEAPAVPGVYQSKTEAGLLLKGGLARLPLDRLTGKGRVEATVACGDRSSKATLVAHASSSKATAHAFDDGGAAVVVGSEDESLALDLRLRAGGDPTAGLEVVIEAGVGSLTVVNKPPGVDVVDDEYVTLRASAADLNTGLKALRYAPPEDWHGTDLVNATLKDLKGNYISARSLLVTIDAVDDAPRITTNNFQASTPSTRLDDAISVEDVDDGGLVRVALTPKLGSLTLKRPALAGVTIEEGAGLIILGAADRVSDALRRIDYVYPRATSEDDLIAIRAADVDGQLAEGLFSVDEVVVRRPDQINGRPVLTLERSSIKATEGDRVALPRCVVDDHEAAAFSQTVHVVLHAMQSNARFLVVDTEGVEVLNEDNVLRLTGTPALLTEVLDRVSVAYPAAWCGADVVTYAASDGEGLRARNATVAVSLEAANDAPLVTLEASDATASVGDAVVVAATFSDNDANGCGDAIIKATYTVVPPDAASLEVDARGLAVHVTRDDESVVVAGHPASLSSTKVSAVPAKEGRFVVEVAAADSEAVAKTKRFVVTANRRSSPAKRRLEAAPAFTGSLATTFTVSQGTVVHLEASAGTFEGPGAKGAGATSTDLGSLRYVPPGESTGVALLRASLDSVTWVEAAARYAPQTGAPFSIEAAVASVTTDVGVAVALDFTLRGGGEFVEVALAGDGVLSVSPHAGARVTENATRIAGMPAAVAATLSTLKFAPATAGPSKVSAAVGDVEASIDVRAAAPPPRMKAKHDGATRLAEDTPANVTALFELVDVGYALPVAVRVTAAHGTMTETIVKGTIDAVRAALSTLEYVPPPDFVGVDVVEAAVALSEGVWGEAARTVVQVTPVGDAPIVTMDAEMTVAGVAPVSLHIEVADADRDDELEVVVVASNGTVSLSNHAAVAAGATVIDGPDAAWTALPQCGGEPVNGSQVRLAGDAARLRRALAAVTYAPPSSVGMDDVRVIVRDGEGRCASASADVRITAAASSSSTVSHEGDVFMELLEDTTGTLPPLQLEGAGALNVSVEASCGGIFELEAGDDVRVWSEGAALGFEASNSKAAAAALARVAFTPPHNFYGGWGAETFEDARSDAIKRFCRSLREDPPSFALKVRSSGDMGWTSKTLRLNVLPQNDPPILTIDGATTAVAADADGAAPWSRVGAGISVSDADAGLLDVRVASKKGALRLSPAATGVEVLATPSTEVSLRGPPRAVERALRAALEFRPAAPGVSTLNVTARDGGGCGAGPEGIAEAQLSVRAAGSRVGLAWAPGQVNATTADVVSVAPRLYANGTLATSAEGAVRLEVQATNGRVALGEDRVRFREPPVKFRLDVESGPAAQMEGVAEVWTVSTRADHVFGRQRIKVEAAASGDAAEALGTVALEIGLTHRNRTSAAFFELGSTAEAARTNLLDALGEVVTLGRVDVSVEFFGASKPGFGAAEIEVTTFQNEPLPLLDISVDRCGPTVEDGTLVEGVSRASSCTARVAEIQKATTTPDVQRISIRANHTFEGGTFTLTYRSPTRYDKPTYADGDFETRPLQYNATIYEVRDALEQLPGVGLVDVQRIARDARIPLANYFWCTARENTDAPTLTAAPTFNTLEPSAKPSQKPSHSQAPTYRTLQPTPGPSETPTSLPTQLPSPLPTELDVDCDFYAVENAWQVTFWTVEGRAPLLVVKHTEGASEEGYERCPECEYATKGAPRDAVGPFYHERYKNVSATNTLCCQKLRPAWDARIAAEAGVERAVVVKTQEASIPLGGELALRWGDRTTSYVSATRAPAGHLKSALEALDPSTRGGIKVERLSRTAEGAAAWSLTFASRFGAVGPIGVDETRLEGGRAVARLDTRGRAPRDVGVYALRVSQGMAQDGFSAATQPISASAAPADVAAALAAAAEAAGIASFNATVETAPKLRAATLAGYVVEIGGGDGERPVVAVESTRGLRKGVDVVLTASDGWPQRAYAVAVDARVPDPITEVQLLRCARSHADSEDETFTLTFQGLESPPIKLGAAPTPAVLPACLGTLPACRGDGSTLLEILQGWLVGEGVIDTKDGVAVEGGDRLCAGPINCLTNECTKAQNATLYGGWGLRAPAETRIRVPGLAGDVEPFAARTTYTSLNPWNRGPGLTNGTFVTITEELRGLAPLVAEVQTVETSATPTEAPTFETEAPTFETEAPTYGTGVPSQQPTVMDTSGIHGVFRLGFRGAATIPLPHDASARQMEDALNALGTNVTVTRVALGTNSYRWRVTFAAGGGDLPLLSNPSATCGDSGAEECHLRVGEAFSSLVEPPYGRPASVTITEVRRGAASVWGSFRLRATPPFRRGAATSDLRVDVGPVALEASLRRLPGCAAATVSMRNASYWVVDGLDDGVALAVDADQLKSSVDCATCTESTWAGCADCIDPTVNVRRLVDHAVVTGAPDAVAAVLSKATYVPEVASVKGGLGRVAYEVTSGEASSKVEGRVFVEATATPPSLEAPAVAFADEGRRAPIDGIATRGTRAAVTLEADGGILSVAPVRGAAVAEDGPSVSINGPSDRVNAALATLTYEAPPSYHSDRLAREVQVVRAYAPPSLFMFAVRTWATGNALVDGTFTLRLNCDYLIDDVKEAIILHHGTKNGSRFDPVHPNASMGLAGVYARVERRLANRTVDITIDADAAARGAGAARDAGGDAEDIRRGDGGNKHNVSFEGKLREGFDACARDALTVAGAQAEFDDWLVAKPNVTSFFGQVLGVSVIRAPVDMDACVRRGLQHACGYDWEVTVAGAPSSFRAPAVVRDGSNKPVGMTVKQKFAASCGAGECNLAMAADATSDVSVRTTRRSVAAASELTLAFAGASTPPLRADASASVIEAALGALPTVTGVRVARDDEAARRDGGRAWAVEFDHLGPQPLLRATATGGAAVVVSRKRAGAATFKRITARVEGGNAEVIEVVVRPKVKAPKLRLAAAEVVAGREDEVVAGLFGGVEVEAAGVVAVEAACERGPCAFLVPTHDGVEAVLAANSVRLRGVGPSIQRVLRNTSLIPGADVDGVDVAVLSVAEGNSVSRAFLLEAVNDAPSIDAGPLGEHLELPRRRVLLNGFVVSDVDDDTLLLTLAAARGTLTMARAARRTLARWSAGDGDGQHAKLEARGAVEAWNNALNYVEYEPPADDVDDVVTLTAADNASSVTQTVSISVTGAASCAARMLLKAQRKFAALVRPDAVGAALEAKVVTEGAVVSLDFSLDAPCGRQARFVAVVAPESGRVRPADAVDLSFASFDDLAKGAMRIEAETAGALEKALGLLVYEPPRDVDGMVSMTVAVEATGGDATGVLETEWWFRIESRDDAPTVSVDVFDDTLIVDAVVARAGASTDVVAAEAASTTGPAFAKGAWSVEDEADFVSVAVEVAGDVALFLSVEEGCRRDACGALHFGNGTRSGRSFSFAASPSDAMKALDALRVVAVADDCWRARDDAAADKARAGALTVSVEDAGGQRATRTVQISARPPRPGALSVAASGGVVDVAEDGRALISGVSVAGGLGTVDGCGDNEVVTVQISARSGRVGSVGNFVGVVVDRVGSALRLRGPRKAVQGVLDSSLPSVATS